MSLTSESRPSSPEAQEQEGARKNVQIDPVASAHLMHDATLEIYEDELNWWRSMHLEHMEKLVNINRAALNGITRELNMVRITRSKINEEVQRRQREWQYTSEENRVHAARAAAAAANVHPLHAPPRHQRDFELVFAAHKVRRANYMALDNLQHDHDTLFTLLSPEGPYSRQRRGPYAVPVPVYLPYPLPVRQNVDIRAEQLAYMSGTVRDLVIAGRVYAVQRSFDKQKWRSAKLGMMWGNLHLHCLVDKPPPPESFTVEHRDILNTLVDRENTLAFLDIQNLVTHSPEERVYIRLNPDTDRGLQFKWLCTGQRGVNYKGVHFHGLLDKGKPRERLLGGDYEGKKGAGGAALIPALTWGQEYRRRWDAGVVRGWWGGMHRAAQFFITTQNGHPGDSAHFAFGQVVFGLDVVRAVVNTGSASAGMVRDCGLVVLEGYEGVGTAVHHQQRNRDYQEPRPWMSRKGGLWGIERLGDPRYEMPQGGVVND